MAVVDIRDPNAITTSLLTLLNVSAIKPGKRKHPEPEFVPSEKLNKRKTVKIAEFDAGTPPSAAVLKTLSSETTTEKAEEVTEGKTDVDDEVESEDAYEKHFGSKPAALSGSSRAAVDLKKWDISKERFEKLGTAIVSRPTGNQQSASTNFKRIDVLDRLMSPFLLLQTKQSSENTACQNELLSILSSRRDLYLTHLPLEFRKFARTGIGLHIVNHVTKRKRRVLKNNERLAHAAKTSHDAEPLEDCQDQGFTRPSILLLLPFRSSALDWFHAITSHAPSPAFQIENQARFLSEYGLPNGAVDKLVSTEPGTYPQDHVETFKGNVDDNFRIGIKLTRKSIKMFAEFYGCDIILASPLGLRRSIEKEKHADYLSSIEILVIDRLDALTMQNWEHVKFVMSHLNKLPKESHDTDISRIKPWYLDGHAAYLRQSILLSSYETPETRALYNSSLLNVEGKIRTQNHWPPVNIPAGLDQNFIPFQCFNPKDEADKRFNYFTTQLLPSVLKSAVQSVNTVVFIPSSFDFIRVHNYFRKQAGVTFTVLSEYSTNQDISRARQAFFHGKKSFLLISERFHFYRRYKIRGIRNFLFYGLPDHPQFFSELLSYPFLDDGVEASDITCRVLYSKYDWFRLERVTGTEGAVNLMKAA